MDPHSIGLPRIVIIGNNVLEKLPDVCRELGAEKSMLVLCDKTTKEIAGSKAKELLQNSGIGALMDIVADSTAQEVDRIVAAGNPGIVVAVGGGRVIDVAKMVAFRKGLPFISVPTAPSHDGIASERASISDGRGRYSLRAKPPAAIVADIGILKNAPPRLIASGAADVISNYTAVNDWRLARDDKGEYYSEYAAALSLLSSEIVIKSASLIREKEERGIRNLVEALVSSGISMSLVGSSRPASGSEHAFSHALDVIAAGAGAKPGLHGQQCGLGAILMACHQGQDWDSIRDALKAVGSAATAGGLGVEKGMVIKALLNAGKVRKRYTILDKKPLSRKSAEDVCMKTGVFNYDA
jgi:glycerol-1-phosphate dehydrogenase [NAD(P)+]